ncbi:MAG: (Fe-S)-binding protein [Candidatus Thiodiazotropha lotti]|uniref:Heterodisulfide reductase n=1 Tax=Candidatus Thiodiazotropha endoloripes TaxID=1818881 RepID=A0A1E2UH59_9GAMM|nr:(Fe-S)-binding protein [Candidatus Thiodiazotropha endoloripes]MCG7899851.1 (Fe-S)-binding protein [Candidatus Thiodiazotropha weberae]MCG7993158.1 (Fe-S)-binding protein [Candidatus Thiodiazotropha lotti]MCG7903909.1 (Fe-S)-binding protein [Candidatus Thiodiazotropha weberae]MCG8000764.1 (Fe-S)-binding protein [Candidatus Thiodiazotropha lotti]MCW4184820.1 (Fe-S)-binding protein [Candidatus Thiodiazotropha weberae]
MSETFDLGVEAMKAQLDAKVASYFSSCVHCGLCAEACLFYTETGDPHYTPIYKLEPMKKIWRREKTFWGKLGATLGMGDELTEQDFADWETLVYDSCTLCGRCSMVCPVGNDITYMIRKQREAFSVAGYAPEGMKEASRRALKFGSPMGVTFKTLQATLSHVEKDTGLTIPVDKQGADYMTLFSSMEIVNFPEYIESIAKIFKRAGVSWTISSKAYEATNSGIQIGNKEIAAELVGRVVEAAEDLGVKYVVSPECGHAYTAIRWEGPNLIGRAFNFEVVHILELLEQLQSEGRLKLKSTEQTPMTLHDPCQIVRRGGVVDQPRVLLNSVADNFKEMPDHGVMNWCCGGGGGVSANERAETLRLEVFTRKKRQLDQTGVDTMVTACANCRIILEEGIEHYEMDAEVISLTELLAEHLEE